VPARRSRSGGRASALWAARAVVSLDTPEARIGRAGERAFQAAAAPALLTGRTGCPHHIRGGVCRDVAHVRRRRNIRRSVDERSGITARLVDRWGVDLRVVREVTDDRGASARHDERDEPQRRAAREGPIRSRHVATVPQRSPGSGGYIIASLSRLGALWCLSQTSIADGHAVIMRASASVSSAQSRR